MVTRRERVAWIVVFATLLVFAVPWFWWGSDQLFLGLPVWIIYHIGWLGLASVVFALFARRAWGIGITGGEPS